MELYHKSMGLASPKGNWKTPSEGKGTNILRTWNSSKKYELVECISMHLKMTPMYYVRYRNEESEDKALKKLINEERGAEVITK